MPSYHWRVHLVTVGGPVLSLRCSHLGEIPLLEGAQPICRFRGKVAVNFHAPGIRSDDLA